MMTIAAAALLFPAFQDPPAPAPLNAKIDAGYTIAAGDRPAGLAQWTLDPFRPEGIARSGFPIDETLSFQRCLLQRYAPAARSTT
jgi:hypothetical protein